MGHSDISVTAGTYVHNDIEVLRKQLKIDDWPVFTTTLLRHKKSFLLVYFNLSKMKSCVNTPFSAYLHSFLGGGDESRTRVRKSIRTTFYECSLPFKIP